MSDPGLMDDTSLIPEAEETIRAIHRGSVDAVVVHAQGRFQVVTFSGADEPSRVLVERMSEGALTVAQDGIVMYTNSRLADMAGRNPDSIIGRPFADLFFGDVPSQYRPWTPAPDGGTRHG